MKVLGVVIAVLGLVSLVFGVVFLVQSASAKNEVLTLVKNETAPVFQYTDGKLVPDRQNLIDTSQEIDQSAEALKSARWALGKPLDLRNQGQVNYLTFEGGLNVARVTLGLSRLVLAVGVVTIVVGLGLVLGGGAVFKLAGARVQQA